MICSATFSKLWVFTFILNLVSDSVHLVYTRVTCVSEWWKQTPVACFTWFTVSVVWTGTVHCQFVATALKCVLTKGLRGHNSQVSTLEPAQENPHRPHSCVWYLGPWCLWSDEDHSCSKHQEEGQSHGFRTLQEYTEIHHRSSFGSNVKTRNAHGCAKTTTWIEKDHGIYVLVPIITRPWKLSRFNYFHWSILCDAMYILHICKLIWSG